MTRPRVVAVLFGLIALAGSVFGAGALAQDDEQSAGHPLVGSWMVSFPNNPATPPSLYTFGADGTVVGESADGARHGSWAATGERTADLTVLGLVGPGPVDVGLVRFRGTVEVGEADDEFTLDYDAELLAPDGLVLSPEGSATARGTRIGVERRDAAGTPAGEATPDAGASAAGTPMVDEKVATALATALP